MNQRQKPFVEVPYIDSAGDYEATVNGGDMVVFNVAVDGDIEIYGVCYTTDNIGYDYDYLKNEIKKQLK